MRFLLLAAALFTVACTHGREARLDRDPWRRPPVSSAEVRRTLAGALERGDRRVVTRSMMMLSRMGATLSPESQARLAPLLDRASLPRNWQPAGPLSQAFEHNFRYNGRSEVAGELVTLVPAELRLIEGIAYDPAKDRLFVGSVVERKVLAREGTAWRALSVAAPLGGVFGMAVDGPRRLLWVASAAAEVVPAADTAFSGLVAFDLDRLEEVRRVPTPGFQPGDVAVARDGTLYVSDSRSGAILRCRFDCTTAETLVPPGLLRSPQGLVPWPSGDRLYVADYSLGIVLIDLGSLRIRPLVARDPVMLEGIDGLYAAAGKLVGIQNGTRPARIVRIGLHPSGAIVESLDVVEQMVPGWGEPTLGALAGSEMFYVADAQWEQWGPGGILRPGAKPRPTAIRRAYVGQDVVVTRREPWPRGRGAYLR